MALHEHDRKRARIIAVATAIVADQVARALDDGAAPDGIGDASPGTANRLLGIVE